MAEKKPEPAPAAAPEKGAAPAAPAGGGIKALLPAIIAIVAAPAATWAVAQFVLIPKLRSAVHEAASGESHEAAPAKAEKSEKAEKSSGHGGKGGEKGGEKGGAEEGYKFENIVVNLSGTMGTRYLKVTFLVTGSKPNLHARFEGSRAQLVDVTLAVLSSLTLADLEESGSKNILRERLLAAYNQVLGERIAEGLFFSEFVVQ